VVVGVGVGGWLLAVGDWFTDHCHFRHFRHLVTFSLSLVPRPSVPLSPCNPFPRERKLFIFVEKYTMQTIIIHAESAKIKAIAAFLKAFGVSFEIKKTEEEPYDPAFVQMILDRAENARKGSTRTINPNDLWGSLGL